METGINKKEIIEFVQDPVLPDLHLALDACYMRGVFQKLLGERYEVTGCDIERIQHRRGKRCKLLYRLKFSNNSGTPCEHWFSGKLVPPYQLKRQHEMLYQTFGAYNGTWRSTYMLDTPPMIIWPFPLDTGMPGLRYAADPHYVKEMLFPGPGVPPAAIRIRQVKYMPGKRCVLQIQAANGKGDSQPGLTVFSKTYSDIKSKDHFHLLSWAHDKMASCIQVPRPIRFHPKSHTFWLEPWEGKPLVENLDELPWSWLFKVLAERIAAIHQVPGHGLRQKFTMKTVWEAAHEDAQMLQWLVPERKALFAESQRELESGLTVAGRCKRPQCTIHGALRLEQFMNRGQELALLDFDALSIGDPLFDVAEFVVSFQYLGLHKGWPADKTERAMEVFLSQYESCTPWAVDRHRMAWYATAFLLGKIHNSIKNLEIPVLRRFDSALLLLENWMGLLK